jgi:hypothetical protein
MPESFKGLEVSGTANKPHWTKNFTPPTEKFGSKSLLLDGNSDYVSIPDKGDWQLPNYGKQYLSGSGKMLMDDKSYNVYFEKMFRLLTPYVGKTHQVQSTLHDNLSLLSHIIEKKLIPTIGGVKILADPSVFEDELPEKLDDKNGNRG